MSIGPLFSELAQSPENSLFDKIGLLLTYALVIGAVVVALIGGIRIWRDRYKDGSDQNE
jgi:cytochrome b subunit of formate dehydrogenase